jgi:transcriptional regulator with XRE-family HTH domain
MTSSPAGAVNGKTAPGNAARTSALIGPVMRRRRLGTELRKLRERRGFRLEDVALKLDVAPSTLSRIETGKAPARTSYVTVMLDFYGIDDQQERRYLTDLAREGQRKGWWAGFDDLLPQGAGSYLGLEGDARKVCTFAVQAVPDLLMTAGYAAAVIRAARPGLAGEQIDRLLAVIMRRQELVHGKCELHAVIDESALLRTFGSAEVMAGQLDRLSAEAGDPLVTIQVLRLARSGQVLSPGFTILSFADEADADVVCASGSDEQVSVTSDSESVSRLRGTFAKLTCHAESAGSSARLIGELRKQHGWRAADE